MRSSHDDRTRQWIEAVSDTSVPIELDDVVGERPGGSSGTNEAPLIDGLNWEEPMRNNRALAALAAAVLIVVAGIALVARGGDGGGLSTELDTPTVGPDEDAENTEDTEDTEDTDGATTRLDAAIGYWESLSANDREATRAAIDPAVLDSAAAMPFGRAESVEGMLDWYDAVDWVWQLEACADESGEIQCTASASNAWSVVIGLPPITGTFAVVVGDDGVTSVAEVEESFASQWVPLVFSPFSDWVATNHPDEAETMFGTPGDVTPEILALYRVNTERFVDAPR